jgi:hypothetical protein
MKRYRLLGADFDSRAITLAPIPDHWEENVKALHRQNQARTVERLRREFGELNFDAKLQNFKDLGAKPFSVIAFHNRFYAQARSSFVSCQYYPALTAIGALGERVLNHLVLRLRDEYKLSESYRRVYRKDSFDNWELAIDALHEWGVLTPEAEGHFRELSRRRNAAIHFNPETEVNDRQLALEALFLFGRIVETQFSGFGQLPWLFTPPGEVYIRKEWESAPFIKLVYLPGAVHVGYRNRVVSVVPWRIEDDGAYEPGEISDDEFVARRVAFQNSV